MISPVNGKNILRPPVSRVLTMLPGSRVKSKSTWRCPIYMGVPPTIVISVLASISHSIHHSFHGFSVVELGISILYQPSHGFSIVDLGFSILNHPSHGSSIRIYRFLGNLRQLPPFSSGVPHLATCGLRGDPLGATATARGSTQGVLLSHTW